MILKLCTLIAHVLTNIWLGGVVISVRDISMLLEALLRTIKSLVLKDIMDKNGEVTTSPTILCIIHNTHEFVFETLLIVITLVYIWQFHESRRSMIMEFKSQTLNLQWHCLFAGLQMFHNLIKQFRKQWIRIPILRKLLKASHHVLSLVIHKVF